VKELRISDRDLQKLIATGIKDALRRAGFKIGENGDGHACVMLPVNIGLTGISQVTHFEDGSWLFEQEETEQIYDRVSDAGMAHFDAMRDAAIKNAGG
jgi:hypothetical protein